MSSPRLLVVADVAGENDYHLGDEAMLEANLRTLRQIVPGIRFTVLSRDPAWTRQRYDVDAVRLPQFPPGPGGVIREAIREADGLLVSGGGNLCGTWPDKVLERISLIELARDHGRPVAVVGQTIGPGLTDDHAVRLARALSNASWVGLRDQPSLTRAARLGIPRAIVHHQTDDAFFLEPEPVLDARADAIPDPRRPLIAVTLDASFGSTGRQGQVIAIAHQLDALAEMLDAALVFVPHVGGADVSRDHADVFAADALRAALRSPLTVLGLWQPREVAWLTARASMVVSSRYHPHVFATAAGVPSLGIHTDAYTRAKLRGALAWAGLDAWSLPIADVARGALLPLSIELWHHRHDVHARLTTTRAAAWTRHTQRWLDVCQALCVTPEPATTPETWGPPLGGPRSDRIGTIISTRTRDMDQPLTDAQWQQFDRDGYLRLGRVLDEAQLAALTQRMDDLMLGRVHYPSIQTQLDTGGAYEDLPPAVDGAPQVTLAYRKVQGLEADPLVLALIRHDVFRESCARAYGRHASISIFRAMMMNKPAGQGTHLPWHQDAGDVWKLDRDPLLTAWTALDPATIANGCLQVIPGSHKLGLLSKQGSTLSEEHARQHCPEDRILFLELEAGEAVLLHNWLLHRSGINSTNLPRRGLTTCYMDGRTMSVLTGARFPIVFGEHEDVDEALPFVRALKEERDQLASMMEEAQRYARSLVADNEQREIMRSGAERYAKSLEAELAKLREAVG